MFPSRDIIPEGLPASPPPSRRLRVEDVLTIDRLPAGTDTLDLWYPLPTDDATQQLLEVSLDLDHPFDVAHDPDHGNQILHLQLRRPGRSGLGLRVRLLVRRSAIPAEAGGASRRLANGLVRPYLRVDLPDEERDARRRLVVEVVAGRTGVLACADRVWEALRGGPGGLESVERFVELCRAAGIPTRLVAGLRLGAGPADEAARAHAWAELFAGERGWVAVDPLCTPADRGLGSAGPPLDHVRLSRGQRLLLQPVQRGARLRAFSGAYCEADGRCHPARSQLRVRVEPPAGWRPAPASSVPVPTLQAMLAEELALLHPAPARVRVARGALLPAASGQGEWLFLLTRGRVLLRRLTAAGRRLELGTLRAPAFFLADCLRRGLVEGVEEGELRSLTREQAWRLACARPELGFHLLEAFAARLVEREDRLEYLAYHTVQSRLALALLRLHDAEGAVTDVTHQQLGDIVGAYRETVTKVLHQLQLDGLIRLAQRRIQVLDPAGLGRQLQR